MNKISNTTKYLIIALVIILVVIIAAECDAEGRISRDTSDPDTVELTPSEPETTAEPAATEDIPAEASAPGTTAEA